MLAEFLSKNSSLDKAIICSLESLKKYPNKEIPAYMWQKHETILKLASLKISHTINN